MTAYSHTKVRGARKVVSEKISRGFLSENLCAGNYTELNWYLKAQNSGKITKETIRSV